MPGSPQKRARREAGESISCRDPDDLIVDRPPAPPVAAIEEEKPEVGASPPVDAPPSEPRKPWATPEQAAAMSSPAADAMWAKLNELQEMTTEEAERELELGVSVRDPRRLQRHLIALANGIDPDLLPVALPKEVVLTAMQSLWGRLIVAIDHRVKAITDENGAPRPLVSRNGVPLPPYIWDRNAARIANIAATATAGYRTTIRMSEGVADADADLDTLVRKLSADMAKLGADLQRAGALAQPVIEVEAEEVDGGVPAVADDEGAASAAELRVEAGEGAASGS